MDVFDALSRARARGEHVVLVTVLAVEGDAPSHPGAKLVVGTAGILAGTLGCAEFDSAGAELAGEAVGQDVPLRRRLSFPAHGPERAIELFAEQHRPEPAVLVMGATPVGRSVAELARTVGRRAVLVAPAGDTAVRGGVEVHADDPARFLLAAPPGPSDALVVSDHDAAWVDEVLRVALASEAFFVGMLGSRRHAPQAVRRLRDAGVPEAHLARLRSPCGLDIGSRTPGEIALSIVGEIVATERGRDGRPMGIDWSADEAASHGRGQT
ncbi:MAG TPA: XdhC family protein [Egibacteraceae bacterium]|nr:XdhC family protein [Egibacteraceae bacterium]